MILAQLAKSFARIPKKEKPIDEALLAGYYRICHTDQLIQHVLSRRLPERDRAFWSKAANEESGHADLYRKDLEGFYGDQFEPVLYRYIPCPEICSLMRWARQKPVHLGVYRAYMESALVSMNEAAKEAFRIVLPRTAEVHLALDPHHIQECVEYLEHFPEEQITEHIETVEEAFKHESLWIGLIQ